jgi:two-component system sensor histidine kinase RegB
MKLATLFRLKENLNLDRKTLVTLRWIALIGQFAAINIVFFILGLDFPIHATYIIILIGILTNIYLQYRIKATQLKDLYSSLFLIFDLFQLGLLLYLTGGIHNPFTFLLIIPAIVSSTFLSMGTTIILGLLTLAVLILITFFHLPLPGTEEPLKFPEYYLIGIIISISIGLIFLSYFGIRFSGETKKRSEALNELQQTLSKEYELESLGGQAAAAAHSLGTPLATITVVAKELRKEIGESSRHTKDLDLLISQTKRCSEILKQISKKEITEDKFFSFTEFKILLSEIIESFKETSNKNIELSSSEDNNSCKIKRSPEIIYGLRNFIGNAIKFAKQNINISLKSNKYLVNILIEDDGPGFPDDIIKILGEPYIKSKSQEISSKSGTGLGTFLGKTLLERKGANLDFGKSEKLQGAKVNISWLIKNLK